MSDSSEILDLVLIMVFSVALQASEERPLFFLHKVGGPGTVLPAIGNLAIPQQASDGRFFRFQAT